jgi:hypothetical protein
MVQLPICLYYDELVSRRLVKARFPRDFNQASTAAPEAGMGNNDDNVEESPGQPNPLEWIEDGMAPTEVLADTGDGCLPALALSWKFDFLQQLNGISYDT